MYTHSSMSDKKIYNTTNRLWLGMISISSPKTEELLIKWLLSEAIRYKNQESSITSAYGLRWATKTRMQKVLFSVIDEFNLPVTRSWYMWGGFVHSNILANDNFTSFRYDYSYNPERALRFRKRQMNWVFQLMMFLNHS